MKQFYSAGTVGTPVIAAILGNCNTATKMGAAQPARAMKITLKILGHQNPGDADGGDMAPGTMDAQHQP